MSLPVQPTSSSPDGHTGRSSSQRGTPFGSLLANSFKVDHYHHHNHHHHHQQHVPHTTDVPPPKEDPFPDVFWGTLLKMTKLLKTVC